MYEVSRELVAASSIPLVLAVLARGENYGYAIIKEVRERSGNVLSWTDGMLYPVLHRLEEAGFVESIWGRSQTGRKRKYYRLTTEGHAELERQLAGWRQVGNTIETLVSTSRSEDDDV